MSVVVCGRECPYKHKNSNVCKKEYVIQIGPGICDEWFYRDGSPRRESRTAEAERIAGELLNRDETTPEALDSQNPAIM